MTENPQKTTDNKNTPASKMTWVKSLSIAVEFGFIIVVPLLVFISLGKWLDNKYHTEVFVYIGIIFSLAASSIWFYRSISNLMKDFKQ